MAYSTLDNGTMNKRVTLKDVAKAAGVHVSTVSRALDPNSKTSLTDEVTARIKSVADEMGYRPNRIAAGLRTSRSMSIGVMIPDITNTMFPPIVRGIESVLEPLGYASILVNTDDVLAREQRLIEVLRERGVDGIISVAAHRDDPAISEIFSQGTPVVTLNRRLDRSLVPFVVHDNEFGISLILKHLVELGHRSIGHISGPVDLSTGQARAQAYASSCRSLGLADCADRVSVAERFDEDEGRRCAVDLLGTHPAITAMVCANDRLAIGAYAGIRSLGKSIPSDVSVTGFNDNPMLELIPPRLTTIRVQQFEAGRTGAEMLLNAISGEKRGAVGIVLPVELIVRESTAAPSA